MSSLRQDVIHALLTNLNSIHPKDWSYIRPLLILSLELYAHEHDVELINSHLLHCDEMRMKVTRRIRISKDLDS